VCEIGISVGSNHAIVPLPGNWKYLNLTESKKLNQTKDAGLGMRRLVRDTGRRLMGLDESMVMEYTTRYENASSARLAAQSDSIATSCAERTDCAAPLTTCMSTWGGPIPCDSCLYGSQCARQVTQEAYWLGTNAHDQTHMCECAHMTHTDNLVPVLNATAESWRGDSFCDRIMRGYSDRNASDLSPLEVANLRRCSDLRIYAEMVAQVTGVNTLPRDMFHSWSTLPVLIYKTSMAFPKAVVMADEAEQRLVARQLGADPNLVASLVNVSWTISAALRALLEEHVGSEAAQNVVDSAPAAFKYGMVTAKTYARAVNLSKVSSMFAGIPKDSTLQKESEAEINYSIQLESDAASARRLLTINPNRPDVINTKDIVDSGCLVMYVFFDTFQAALQEVTAHYMGYFQQVSIPKFFGTYVDQRPPSAPRAPPAPFGYPRPPRPSPKPPQPPFPRPPPALGAPLAPRPPPNPPPNPPPPPKRMLLSAGQPKRMLLSAGQPKRKLMQIPSPLPFPPVPPRSRPPSPPLPPMPPFPPDPPGPPPPDMSSTDGYSDEYVVQGATRPGFETAFSGIVSGIIGVDVVATVKDYVNRGVRPISASKHGSASMDQVIDWVAANSKCPHETLYNQVGHQKLVDTFFTTGVQALLLCLVSGLVLGSTFSSLVAIITTAVLFGFIPVVLSRAYDISIACFVRAPPLMPAALADDLFDIVNMTLLPRCEAILLLPCDTSFALTIVRSPGTSLGR